MFLAPSPHLSRVWNPNTILSHLALFAQPHNRLKLQGKGHKGRGLIHLIQHRIVKESHCRSAQAWHTLSRDFTVSPAYPCVYLWTGWRTCLCLLSRSWSSLSNPRWMEGWVGLSNATVSKQSAMDHYMMAITIISCSDCRASLGNWSTSAEHRTHDLSDHKPQC